MLDFAVSFLFPTLLGKSFMLYFGMYYSRYPGEGYGIGLVVSILFTLTMMGRLFWKYRNYKDD